MPIAPTFKGNYPSFEEPMVLYESRTSTNDVKDIYSYRSTRGVPKRVLSSTRDSLEYSVRVSVREF